MHRFKVAAFALVASIGLTVSCGGSVSLTEGTWQLTAISVTTSKGTTNIDNPGIGRLTLSGGQYSQVWMQSDRLYSNPPTNLEKLDAFDSFDASAGSYTYANSQLTLTPQISRDPSGVGVGTTTDVTVEGDAMQRTRERPDVENPGEMLTWTSTYSRVP